MKICLALIRESSGNRTPYEINRSQVLLNLVKPVAEEVGLVFKCIDPHDYGLNDYRIFNMIEAADVMIVDAAAKSYDYFYSLGVRHALTTKPTFILTEADDLPVADVSIPKGIISIPKGIIPINNGIPKIQYSPY